MLSMYRQFLKLTRDPYYSAEKRNNISEINNSLNRHVSAFGFVNGKRALVTSS